MPRKHRNKAAKPRGWYLNCDHCGQQCFVPENEWWVDCTSKDCNCFVVAPLAPNHQYVRVNCVETTYERLAEHDVEVNCECCQESVKFIIDDTIIAEKLNGQDIFSTFSVEEAYDVVRDLREEVSRLKAENQGLEEKLMESEAGHLKDALELRKKKAAVKGYQRQLLKERLRRGPAVKDVKSSEFTQPKAEFKHPNVLTPPPAAKRLPVVKTPPVALPHRLDDLMKSALMTAQQGPPPKRRALNTFVADMVKSKNRFHELESKLAAIKMSSSSGKDCLKHTGKLGAIASCVRHEAGPNGEPQSTFRLMVKTSEGTAVGESSAEINSAMIGKFMHELEKTIMPKLRPPPDGVLESVLATMPPEDPAPVSASGHLPTFEEIVERFPLVKDKWRVLRTVYCQWMMKQQAKGWTEVPSSGGDPTGQFKEDHGDFDERMSADAAKKTSKKKKKKSARR